MRVRELDPSIETQQSLEDEVALNDAGALDEEAHDEVCVFYLAQAALEWERVCVKAGELLDVFAELEQALAPEAV